LSEKEDAAPEGTYVDRGEAGADVTVITCFPNFPQGKVYDGYSNALMKREEMNGINVIRVWTYINANEGFFRRSLDYISFAFSSFMLGLFQKADVIIATDIERPQEHRCRKFALAVDLHRQLAAPGLHLNENDQLTIIGYEIDLTRGSAPLSCEDCPADLGKPTFGEPLPGISQSQPWSTHVGSGTTLSSGSASWLTGRKLFR
jgi:hypothetical protein